MNLLQDWLTPTPSGQGKLEKLERDKARFGLELREIREKQATLLESANAEMDNGNEQGALAYMKERKALEGDARSLESTLKVVRKALDAANNATRAKRTVQAMQDANEILEDTEINHKEAMQEKMRFARNAERAAAMEGIMDSEESEDEEDLLNELRSAHRQSTSGKMADPPHARPSSSGKLAIGKPLKEKEKHDK